MRIGCAAIETALLLTGFVLFSFTLKFSLGSDGAYRYDMMKALVDEHRIAAPPAYVRAFNAKDVATLRPDTIGGTRIQDDLHPVCRRSVGGWKAVRHAPAHANDVRPRIDGRQ